MARCYRHRSFSRINKFCLSFIIILPFSEMGYLFKKKRQNLTKPGIPQPFPFTSAQSPFLRVDSSVYGSTCHRRKRVSRRVLVFEISMSISLVSLTRGHLWKSTASYNRKACLLQLLSTPYHWASLHREWPEQRIL